MFLRILYVCVTTICLSLPLHAHAQKMGIVTGGPSGTYIKFGRDIALLAEKFGISMDVFESKGSLQNLEDVRWRKGVQLGIVQSDALQVAKNKAKVSRKSKKIADGLRMVLPLYDEEVHVLARRDANVETFNDLDGKRIAAGTLGSGHYLTSLMMFVLADVVPSDFIEASSKDAVDALKSGEADAMIYVAGVPSSLMINEVTADDDLHLVPILDKSIIDQYPIETTLSAGTYDWQTEDVSTVAVTAVLMTFNYRGTNCDYVGKMARIVADNHDWLKRNGHKKWEELDLERSIKDWEQYDCVQESLHNALSFQLSETGQPIVEEPTPVALPDSGDDDVDLRRRVEELLK